MSLMGGRVLVMTVGVGDAENVETTLFAPLRKSIEAGEWDLVVLLPSQVTAERAVELRQQLMGMPVDIVPIPTAGAENDADACFAHFDGVLRQLAGRGARPRDIVADFTRGTKAMSAALVLAATAAGVPLLRYVYGERDSRGTVKAGREQIGNFSTDRVAAREKIRESARLLQSLHFTAAATLATAAAQAAGEVYRQEADWLKWLGELWGAWDRFDFVEVERLSHARPLGQIPPQFAVWSPTEEQLQLTARMAHVLPDEHHQCGVELRARVTDMLQNGRRRIQLGHLEDAALRAYRALELFGQIRLFFHGYDSGAIPGDDQKFKDYLDYKRKKQAKKREVFHAPLPNKQGCYEIPRQSVASFLRFLGDPNAESLCDPKKHFGWDPNQRNHSNLVHGFNAMTRTAAATELRALYDKLDHYWSAEDPGNPKLFDLTRFPFG